MKKSEIKEIVNRSIDQRNLCRMLFRYDSNYRYYFPLYANDKFFLGAEEDEFIIDGYSIRKFVDVTKVQCKDDLCLEILKNEGIIENIKKPNVDISNWETIFNSLKLLNKNVIVEKDSLDDDEWVFYIGKIDRVYKNYVYFYHFDADGIWQEEPLKIHYTGITSVSFGTRYVEVFSKYLDKLKINKD